MGLSDGDFFMIKHTPLPNENHPILSLICPIGVADTLGPYVFVILVQVRKDGLEKIVFLLSVSSLAEDWYFTYLHGFAIECK